MITTEPAFKPVAKLTQPDQPAFVRAKGRAVAGKRILGEEPPPPYSTLPTLQEFPYTPSVPANRAPTLQPYLGARPTLQEFPYTPSVPASQLPTLQPYPVTPAPAPAFRWMGPAGYMPEGERIARSIGLMGAESGAPQATAQPPLTSPYVPPWLMPVLGPYGFATLPPPTAPTTAPTSYAYAGSRYRRGGGGYGRGFYSGGGGGGGYDALQRYLQNLTQWTID